MDFFSDGGLKLKVFLTVFRKNYHRQAKQGRTIYLGLENTHPKYHLIRLECYDMPIYVTFFFVAVVKHHDSGNLQKKRLFYLKFPGVYSPLWQRQHSSRWQAWWQNNMLGAHIMEQRELTGIGRRFVAPRAILSSERQPLQIETKYSKMRYCVRHSHLNHYRNQ